MDKFLVKKKRKSDDEKKEESSSPKKKTKAKEKKNYVFLVCPGAGGGDCKDLVEVLQTLGRTQSVKKWVGNFPSQMKGNVELLRSTAAPKKDEVLVYVGHSFGCRVIAEGLKDDAVPAILESYPLFGPSKPKNSGTDRVAPLKAIPKGRFVLAVSGTKDPFLDRDWLDKKAPTGTPALQAVLDESPCTSRLVTVDGAGHNTLKVAKSKQLTNRGILRDAIASFLDDL